MRLNPFEAARYDDESIVVLNPANGKQELFTQREYEIVKFLKQNESQSLLALLMPNIGIAKKSHIVMCLSVLTKLKRMQIVDYMGITGRQPLSQTTTMDISDIQRRIEFHSLNALAVVIYTLVGKILSMLGQAGLLGLMAALAAFSFALFPFRAVSPSLADHPPSYFAMFITMYMAATGALWLRSLTQAAFLKSAGKEAQYPSFTLYFPLIGLNADYRAVNMMGYRARIQMAVLGLISPLALGALFTVCAMFGQHQAAAFVGFCACAGMSVILACPFLPFDGAQLLQAVFFRKQLEEGVSKRLREILYTKGSLGREMLIVLFVALFWLVIWFDCLYSVRDIFSMRVADDLTAPVGSMSWMGATFTVVVLVALLLFPLGIVLFEYLRLYSRASKRRVVVAKDKVKDSLTFEERLAALERIPLFASLNDQERLALLNEMHPAYYKHDDFLVHQGELGKEFFVLVKGQACAFFTDMQSNRIDLADLVAGDAFGEIALIDDVPRTASIVSDGGCIALVLRKEGFDRFSQSIGSPDRVKAMIRLTSFFRRHPLFSKLGPRDQAMLIDHFRFETITAHEEILTPDEAFHVIYSGAVRVDTGAEGETDLHADDCFGYANPLNAHYVALEGTGLLTVSKDEFHSLIWEKLVERPELFI